MGSECCVPLLADQGGGAEVRGRDVVGDEIPRVHRGSLSIGRRIGFHGWSIVLFGKFEGTHLPSYRSLSGYGGKVIAMRFSAKHDRFSKFVTKVYSPTPRETDSYDKLYSIRSRRIPPDRKLGNLENHIDEAFSGI